MRDWQILPGDGATDFVTHFHSVKTADCGYRCRSAEVGFSFSLKHKRWKLQTHTRAPTNIKINFLSIRKRIQL